jgi:pimeloyl-ACP methyl ester carboxylesterase
MPRVKVGDINLYYEIHGKGEPFVYINGFGATTETLTDRIAAFTKDYRVIIYDTRGAGLSDAPNIPYTPAMMADDLAGLLDAIGVKAAHICGESFGGMIAQHFVLGYPQKVTSLILRCTTCGGPHSAPHDPEYDRLYTDPELLRLPAADREKLRSTFMFSLAYTKSHPDKVEAFLNPKTAIKYPTSPQGYKRLSQVSATHDTYDRLPQITTPTLVIHGDADRIINPENARILAARIRGAELVILTNAGHLLAEVPEEVNKTMLEFLKKHKG